MLCCGMGLDSASAPVTALRSRRASRRTSEASSGSSAETPYWGAPRAIAKELGTAAASVPRSRVRAGELSEKVSAAGCLRALVCREVIRGLLLHTALRASHGRRARRPRYGCWTTRRSVASRPKISEHQRFLRGIARIVVVLGQGSPKLLLVDLAFFFVVMALEEPRAHASRDEQSGQDDQPGSRT